MKSGFWLFLLVISISSGQVLAQQVAPVVDLAAYFDLKKTCDDNIENISLQFSREIQQNSKNRLIKISVENNSGKDIKYFLDSLNSRFYVQIEVSKGHWEIDRSLNIPFVFNVYRNNFKIEAFVRLYRRGIKIPVLTKNFNIKVSGSRVFQVLRNNPNDGGLLVTNSRRIMQENQAQKKLVRKISSEVFNTMREYGG